MKLILRKHQYSGKSILINWDTGEEKEERYDIKKIGEYLHRHSNITYQKINSLETFDISYNYFQDKENVKHGKIRSLLLVKS